MKNKEKVVHADLVIAGGGIAGICNALQAARLGIKTALINNRTHFGGNGSAELMINISGAAGMQEFNFNARETGIIEELWLENLTKNPTGNRWLWDGIILDKLYAEKNLSLFANTCIDEVIMEGKNIKCICGTQSTTETRYRFYAPIFTDATGDGTVAFLAGAEYRYGREAKSEFGERIAPDEADRNVIPSTMVFFSEKRDHPIKYYAPEFATDFTKTDVFKYRIIPKDSFDQFMWFYEIDGKLDQIYEAEEILKHHKEFVYGIWDYIKNSGEFDSQNHELSYVSPIMGKRESRRVMGDYILKEQDVTEQRDFDDTVAHGGWSIDLHAIDGFYSKEPINRHVFLNGVYQIPYRCGYSKDVDNLFLSGRCMSATHLAFGTVRVMATLAAQGQANGTAAYLCRKHDCTPRDIGKDYIEELQRLLLKNDQYIVGKKYIDNENLATKAKVTVSSERFCGYNDGGEEISLSVDYGITVPVIEKFKGISVFAKADENTKIRYAVFKPSKAENYNPHIKLYEGETEVGKGEEYSEVSLCADLTLETGFYFIWIYKNERVKLKCGKRQLTESVTSYHKSVNAPNYIDLLTLEPKSERWQMLNGNICFEMLSKEHIFAGENLVNGYSRPYRLPNAWQSEGVQNEFIELKWEEKINISQIVIILDSYLSEYFRNEIDRKEQARPMLVRDYDIDVMTENGEYETVSEIRNNYQRINRININSCLTDSVRIRFLSTNGQPYISVYDVRVYR